MRSLVIVLFFLLLNVIVNSQNSLDAALIPDSLKENANAVCRYSITEYTRISKTRVQLKVKYANTILNKNGEDAASIKLFYDKFESVNYLKGNFYNARGILRKKLKKDEIKDFSYYADYTLFNDNRVKYVNFTSNDYPYTVEYEYEITMNGIVGFDIWMPIRYYNYSVEKAELIYNTPVDISFKYKELNHHFNLRKSTVKKKERYHWIVENLTADEYEQHAPLYDECLPIVLLSPDEFSYDGKDGNLRSWETYGQWVYDLNRNRDELDESTVAEIRALTDTIDQIKRKAELIYKYMQSKTRYVNIALGIGGFQPMKAKDVDNYGYGDCKALSNYTSSLLKVAGIKSYYAVIGNGEHRKLKYPDFASANQLNHAILCVPFEHDTVWLECTSQNYPFGFIGKGNSDRNALLITEKGGVITKTPKYPLPVNHAVSNAVVHLGQEGDMATDIEVTLGGLIYSYGLKLSRLSKKEQKEELLKTLPIKSLKIEDFDVKCTHQSSPVAEMSVNAISDKFASKVGKRMFVELNLLSKYKNRFDKKKSRQTDIYFPYGYKETDTITYHIPGGYAVDFLPESKKLSSRIGECKYTITSDGQKVFYIREFKMFGGTYSKDHFKEIQEYAESLEKSDNAKMILILED